MFNLSDLHKITSILSPSGLLEQFKKLLGAYEEKVNEVEQLKDENRELKDRLKKFINEPEVPKFKPKDDKKDLHHPKPTKKDRKKNWKKKEKNGSMKIDREEKCSVDKETLPSDAEFKGHREIIIQNISLQTDNVKFKIERWYSPSQKKYFEGTLPSGFQGSQFGPDLRSLIVTLYVGLRSTENKIEKFLKDLGIVISSGEISRILTNVSNNFSKEMEKAKDSAILKTSHLHIDATGMNVRGESYFNLCHSNSFMSYHSLVKDRSRYEAIRSLITNKNPLYLFDQAAYEWIEDRVDGKKIVLKTIEKMISEKIFNESDFISMIKDIDDERVARFMMTSALISAWKKGHLGIIPDVLISDSAGEYRDILDAHQECWIHELRHYRAIKISGEYVKEELDEFFNLAWDFFDLMEGYKINPSLQMREKIETDFNKIFNREWNSFMINHCRGNTLKRKENLLTFLDHPKIPIHNNQVESDIREKVVRRKISGGHKSEAGAAAGNMWLSLYQTTRKNGVSFFLYLRDRFNDFNQIAQLSTLIELRA